MVARTAAPPGTAIIALMTGSSGLPISVVVAPSGIERTEKASFPTALSSTESPRRRNSTTVPEASELETRTSAPASEPLRMRPWLSSFTSSDPPPPPGTSRGGSAASPGWWGTSRGTNAAAQGGKNATAIKTGINSFTSSPPSDV